MSPAWIRALLGSPSRGARDLTTLDDEVRAALPLSRRVSFVSVAGGSGTTSALVSVGSLLARRRSGLVLAVDAGGGHSGVWRQAGLTGSVATHGYSSRLRAAQTATEARTGLGVSDSGLHVLDVAAAHRRPAFVRRWEHEVEPVGRFFDLVLTDWGVRAPSMDLSEVAAVAHVVVMVGRADRRSATTAAAALAGLRDSGSRAALMLALTDVDRTPDRFVSGLRREVGLDVHVLPREPERALANAPGSRGFSAATRTANLRLAAAVVSAAVQSRRLAVRPDAARPIPGPLTAPVPS